MALSKRHSLLRHIENLELRFGVHEGSPTIVDFDRRDRTKIMKMIGFEKVKEVAVIDRKFENDPYALNKEEQLKWLRERGWKKASIKKNANI